MRKPLSLEELKEMAGQPVYCPELAVYGIVRYETIGFWAGRPFLCGIWHNKGVGTKFEYDIKKRDLKCYRVGPDIAEEFKESDS